MTNEHAWCSDERIAQLSNVEYGSEFALKVAKALVSGKNIVNNHRDYCGLALFYENSEYVLAYCNDGCDFDPIEKFASEEAFVEFLAKQSDFTLSGADKNSKLYEESTFARNNQRINRACLASLL
ncbi:predicted protein [Naegleria gruberi]|uniref:Predicted protein n=1 Tax=Naegleria gruberi TaxID=5762 RepID=D2V9E4_NAEGR|nr:uncharacterized protein NAEGRDRAFT_65412 [Naegleria gruberi]EFC46575.1 predicted protein [Naegleria gruberi]|eukprot:XP_002679319.1 predicted protein [Naegleria gruberi strain NEG-M]